MANKNFSGVLRDPTGELAYKDKFRFTHVSTTGEVIRGAISYVDIPESGAYNFDLEYGNILIQSRDKLSSQWIRHGVVTVNQDTSVTTLPALLLASVPATPELVIQLEQILNDAETAASDAAQSATDAANAADSTVDDAKAQLEGYVDDAEQSASEAQQSASNAADYASAAKNYTMRKVEFEARRAANNETFAASGFVHFGKHYQSPIDSNVVSSGLWTSQASDYANKISLGRGYGESSSGDSKTTAPVINLAGVIFELAWLSDGAHSGRNVVKLPSAEDGTRTYDSATGISVTHATPAIAFASETETNKVVTDRVDMWGFEAFLREITDADPFVYAKGLIQSLAGDINGVATVSDNVRPASYFAWYEGDEDSRGKGVNWQTATEAQRIKIASDPENNIYFDDETGKFYQWCVRGRSFAGAGNGDWRTIYSISELIMQYDSNSSTRTKPLGYLNVNTGSVNQTYFAGSGEGASYNTKPFTGSYTAQGSSAVAINGECYFLVCGTVNRLNSGLYHVGLNSNGSVADTNGDKWYDTSLSFPTQADCFDLEKISHD